MSGVNILAPSQVATFMGLAERDPDAMPTHLPSLNNVCGDMGGGVGVAMGWHVVIGGDTGHGKSLLALNLCKDAVAAGERIGFVSLEMSAQQLATRFYAMLTMTPVYRLEPGKHYSAQHYGEVQRFVDDQFAAHGLHPFMVNETPYSEIHHVLGLMDEWRKEHGCRVFVVDYLQLCSAGDEDSMVRELTQISNLIRSYAYEHNVITIALSQYSYGASKNTAVPPSIHSLYGSARIGQDSNLCILLDHSRRERVRSSDGRADTARTWLVIAKNRHGPDGEIPIEWNYKTLTSSEADPDQEAQWPQ